VTDVIGTADVDAPPRHRAWRIPRWVVWAVAAVVVAAVVIVPRERSRLADSSAHWLQQQWLQRGAFDDARAALINTVSQKAGALDESVVDEAAAVGDREEAASLRTILRDLSLRRTWAEDVTRARDAAMAAVRAEIGALDRDAADATPTTGYLFAPGVERLVMVASKRVASMARRHHLGPPPAATARLTPAHALLDRLHRPTDFPTGLSIVAPTTNKLEVIDLDSGAMRALHLPRGEAELRSWAGHMLVQSSHGVMTLSPTGEPQTRFTRAPAELVSTGGSTIWLSGPRGVRQFAADGHPLTPWIPVPPRSTAVAATGSAVAIARVVDEATVVGEVWDPLTGRHQPLPPRCNDGGWAAAGGTIVSIPCGGDRSVTSMDADSGTVRHVALPGRIDDSTLELFNPLSPDGRQLAVVLARSVGPTPGLLDLRTGRFLAPPVDPTLTPLCWSADGSWVLLGDASSFSGGQIPRAALWSPTEGLLTSVRLPFGVSLDWTTQLLKTSSG
jgi:hypothetical protein